MKKSSIADIVEKTVDFLERTGADRLVQQYLHYALATFAAGCEEQLAHYLVRYDIPFQRPARETAQLIIHSRTSDLACFILDSYANLIGRVDPQTHSYPNVDLTVFDSSAKVSRRHAKIYSLDGRNFWIEDLDSFNGTSVNGTRLSVRQPHPLHDGDQILFGNTLVTFGTPVSDKSIVAARELALHRSVEELNTSRNQEEPAAARSLLRRPPAKTQENEPVQLDGSDLEQ